MYNIETIYQYRRDYQNKQREKREEEIYGKFPELLEIDNNIRLYNIKIAEIEIFNTKNNESLENLKLKLIEFKRKRDTLIDIYNINEGDFSTRYYCEDCKDTGVIFGSENQRKCHCYLKLQEKLRYGQEHLNSRIENENFNCFDINIFDNVNKYDFGLGDDYAITERENIKYIQKESIYFVKNLEDKSIKNLLFHGDVGLGKSFMCSCIADLALKNGKTVLYYTINELINIAELYSFNREIFFQKYTLEDYNAIEKSDLLIIDDLGTEITNEFVKTLLFNVINARIINNKKMVISTNVKFEDIEERYDDRLMSRFLAYFNICSFFGSDKRLK